MHSQVINSVIIFGNKEFGSMENGNTAGMLLHVSLVNAGCGSWHLHNGVKWLSFTYYNSWFLKSRQNGCANLLPPAPVKN